jgi:hypothetical protein
MQRAKSPDLRHTSGMTEAAFHKAIGEMSLQFNAIEHMIHTTSAALLRCREEKIAFALLRRYQFDGKVKLADELAKHYEEEHPNTVEAAKHFRVLLKRVRRFQEKRNKIMHALISMQFGENGLPAMLVTTDWNPIDEDIETITTDIEAMKELTTELIYAYADLRLKVAELDGDDPVLRGSE